MFVLMVTSVKEGYEDLQRAWSDRDENNRKVIIVKFNDDGSVSELEVETHCIKAGDIVKLQGTQPVPADLLLIMTSTFADGNQCYVETANIDGETNLKVKEAPAHLAPLVVDGIPTQAMFTGSIDSEGPNKNIHNFIGTLHLDALDRPLALCAENLLLRGSLFSNTDWGYGIAVYTGQETKIQMNNRHAPSKMSKLEEYLNRAIIIIFFSQVALVTASVISIYIMGFNVESSLPYVYPSAAGSSSILPLWLEQW